jgi:hypothetical protein
MLLQTGTNVIVWHIYLRCFPWYVMYIALGDSKMTAPIMLVPILSIYGIYVSQHPFSNFSFVYFFGKQIIFYLNYVNNNIWHIATVLRNLRK